jgi:hypothetical protein
VCYVPDDLRGSIERARARSDGRAPVRRTGRLSAALTALAFVLSSLFGLIHEGTTKHVRCAEHGELIDGGPASPASAGAVSHARAAIAGVFGRGAVIRDLEAIAMHGHEHCSLASAMRESRVVPRPPAVAPAPVAVGDLEVAPALVAVAPRGDLYRTAPKTSPPV